MKTALFFIVTSLLVIGFAFAQLSSSEMATEPMTTENRFGLEETARFIEALEAHFRAEGYEPCEIAHRIRHITDQIRQERLRIRNQESTGMQPFRNIDIINLMPTEESRRQAEEWLGLREQR